MMGEEPEGLGPKEILQLNSGVPEATRHAFEQVYAAASEMRADGLALAYQCVFRVPGSRFAFKRGGLEPRRSEPNCKMFDRLGPHSTNRGRDRKARSSVDC